MPIDRGVCDGHFRINLSMESHLGARIVLFSFVLVFFLSPSPSSTFENEELPARAKDPARRSRREHHSGAHRQRRKNGKDAARKIAGAVRRHLVANPPSLSVVLLVAPQDFQRESNGSLLAARGRRRRADTTNRVSRQSERESQRLEVHSRVRRRRLVSHARLPSSERFVHRRACVSRRGRHTSTCINGGESIGGRHR